MKMRMLICSSRFFLLFYYTDNPTPHPPSLQQFVPGKQKTVERGGLYLYPPVLFTAHFESVQRKLILLLHVQHEIAAAAAAWGDGREQWLLREVSNI